MSYRSKDSESARLSTAEYRARSHAERQRIKSELRSIVESVGKSRDVDECDEPAVGFKPAHHHQKGHASEKAEKRRIVRHWKIKAWKRRKALRRLRADKQRHPDEDI